MTAISRSKTESLVSDVKILRQLLSPLAADGISIASFRPIVDKCSLKAFDKPVVLFIETPFTISSLVDGVLLFRDVSFLF